MIRRLVPILAVAALLAGCSGFPNQGPVAEGPRVDGVGIGAQALAPPPAAGAGPAAIVAGFLTAGEDVHEDHKVAREFLASAQMLWNPADGVVVLAAAPRITVQSGGSDRGQNGSPDDDRVTETATVRVQGTVTARVDRNGLMRLPTAGATDEDSPVLDITYQLVRDDHGRWRIARLPGGADGRGLVLTTGQFGSTFRAVSLYFAEPGDRWLVPDLRWFPDLDYFDPTPTATLAVKALLSGPAPWLGDVGTTGPRAKLTAVGGVKIDRDVVHVDLDPRIIDTTKDRPEQRRILRAQLLATLHDLVNASQVVLTADQARLEVPEGPVPSVWSGQPVPASAQLGRADGEPQPRLDAASPLCLTGANRVGELDQSGTKPTCRESAAWSARAGAGLRLPTSDASGTLVAGVVHAGTGIVAAAPSVPPRQVLTGAGLTAPSVDPEGWVWSTTGDGRVVAGALAAKQRTVGAVWLDGARVTSVRLSREGARALLLVVRNGVTQAVVTGVVRGEDGAPAGFATGALPVIGDVGAARDAAWLDDSRVVVLGNDPARKGLYVIGGQVGGEAGLPFVPKPAPAGAVGLAVNSDVDVYVRLAAGTTFAFASVPGVWKPMDVRDLTLPN
jgi:hypothetical protein